jgi:hypothetical protein
LYRGDPGWLADVLVHASCVEAGTASSCLDACKGQFDQPMYVHDSSVPILDLSTSGELSGEGTDTRFNEHWRVCVPGVTKTGWPTPRTGWPTHNHQQKSTQRCLGWLMGSSGRRRRRQRRQRGRGQELQPTRDASAVPHSVNTATVLSVLLTLLHISHTMFEPIRGGTRGGQAEFKWTDVVADKDREVRRASPRELVPPSDARTRRTTSGIVSTRLRGAGRRTRTSTGMHATNLATRTRAPRSRVSRRPKPRL